MLGLVIGVVSTISLLVFLQHDPKAVMKHKQEQKKIREERQQQIKKVQEERQKIINDPAAAQKRQEKKRDLKQKMMKGLSEEERKLIGDYINQKKNQGKSEEQIMKEASVKAFAFFCVLMFITVLSVIFIFIMYTGKEEEVVTAVVQLKQSLHSLLEWAFPRFANASSGEPNTEL